MNFLKLEKNFDRATKWAIGWSFVKKMKTKIFLRKMCPFPKLGRFR